MATEPNDDDRLFVRDGWRHYRRRYSLAEVRWGLGTLAVLVLIAGWVAWKGAHPDPALFADGAELLKAAPTGNAAAVNAAAPTPPPSAGTGTPAAASAAAPMLAAASPLPKDLAGPGWRAEKYAQFDADNLYVKIDGRADYFRAFGFRRMDSVLLVSEQDPGVTIDVEMYDLGTPANALGAYGGERAPNAVPQVTAAGLQHFDRNALYLAQGPYYLRVIGSDETANITAKLRALGETLGGGIKGEPLPWAYGLFVGQLGIPAGHVMYFAVNAFALAFASDVWTARPRGKDDDLELFAVALGDDAAARAFAKKLHKTFLELGAPAGKVGGVALVKDQFLGLISAAATTGRFVVGVRGAADKTAALAELTRLREAIAKAPAELLERARPAAPPAASGGEKDTPDEK